MTNEQKLLEKAYELERTTYGKIALGQKLTKIEKITAKLNGWKEKGD